MVPRVFSLNISHLSRFFLPLSPKISIKYGLSTIFGSLEMSFWQGPHDMIALTIHEGKNETHQIDCEIPQCNLHPEIKLCSELGKKNTQQMTLHYYIKRKNPFKCISVYLCHWNACFFPLLCHWTHWPSESREHSVNKIHKTKLHRWLAAAAEIAPACQKYNSIC